MTETISRIVALGIIISSLSLALPYEKLGFTKKTQKTIKVCAIIYLLSSSIYALYMSLI